MTDTKTRRPVAEGLFTEEGGEARLIGSRCRDCGVYAFPAQATCARCTGVDTEQTPLARRGTLWTWTIQGFPPPSPPYLGPATLETFRPYGVGYVQLPGELLVEARLTEADPARLRIGMEMELVLVPLTVDDDGGEVVTFAFQPLATSEAS